LNAGIRAGFEKMLFGAFLETKYGWFAAAVSDKGVAAVCLPNKTRDGVRRALKETLAPASIVFPDHLPDLARSVLDALEQYFQTGQLYGEFPLDLERYSAFDRDIWKAAQRIPSGKTLSYGRLTVLAGHPRAARAAGGALGRNPLPVLIPCHRVVRSDGSPGGFGAGVAWKIRLLDLEGITLKK